MGSLTEWALVDAGCGAGRSSSGVPPRADRSGVGRGWEAPPTIDLGACGGSGGVLFFSLRRCCDRRHRAAASCIRCSCCDDDDDDGRPT